MMSWDERRIVRWIGRALACLLCAYGVAASGAGGPHRSTADASLNIASKVLGETRSYRVYLPVSYHDTNYAPVRYPVVYMLDGQSGFPLYWEVVAEMSGRAALIPEVIVVAVDTEAQRVRDLTPVHSLAGHQGKQMEGEARRMLADSGGADRFLSFLATELIPHVDATYRTAPHRTLIGHSLGGLAAAHSLLTQPHLFQGYLSIDGSFWWADRWMVEQAQKLASGPDLQGRFYLSLAHVETTGPQESSAHLLANLQFAEVLHNVSLAAPRLQSQLQRFEEENHASVVLPSLRQGLRFVFDGYTFEGGSGAIADPSGVAAHFKRFSERLGYEFLPPERLVEFLANTLSLAYAQPQAALAYLQMNVRNYPSSAHAQTSLAILYAQLGDDTNARRAFERALQLNPKYEAARKGLADLDAK
jgi:predicted alpha/beta superfamily hydrolase